MDMEYWKSTGIKYELNKSSKDTLINAIAKNSEVAAGVIKLLLMATSQDKSALINILTGKNLSLSKEKIEEIIKELEVKREELKTKIARALKDKKYYKMAVYIYKVNINSEDPVDKIALELESENTSFEMMDKRVKNALNE